MFPKCARTCVCAYMHVWMCIRDPSTQLTSSYYIDKLRPKDSQGKERERASLYVHTSGVAYEALFRLFTLLPVYWSLTFLAEPAAATAVTLLHGSIDSWERTLSHIEQATLWIGWAVNRIRTLSSRIKNGEGGEMLSFLFPCFFISFLSYRASIPQTGLQNILHAKKYLQNGPAYSSAFLINRLNTTYVHNFIPRTFFISHLLWMCIYAPPRNWVVIIQPGYLLL